MKSAWFPKAQGLYDAAFEKDACGVGLVCDIAGRKSNALVAQALEVLCRLAHRGATGSDPRTGDGAGILMQIPHMFLSGEAKKNKFILGEPGAYGTGNIFFPPDAANRRDCRNVISALVQEAGLELLGWRSVPVDSSCIGDTARSSQPVIEQIFIARPPDLKDILDFERRLYVVRKRIESRIAATEIPQKAFFYITNLSCRTMIYKGLLMPHQVGDFFLDLRDARVESAICLVHSRYSTNTFPSWDLAQPFRFLAHNGEINTLRGNRNAMKAREGLLESPLYGKSLPDVRPVIAEGGSDSAALDNMFEFLTLSGRSVAHSMMMLVPPAWQQNSALEDEVRDFYRYHACVMEAWDGPAAVAFTDGVRVGAVLDRNGLRPARILITKQGMALMASEVGVLDIKPEDIETSSRLEPGKMFFINTQTGRIITDYDLKKEVSSKFSYSAWIRESLVEFDSLPVPAASKEPAMHDARTALKSFGYTREDIKRIIVPMALEGKEPIGSMGNDTPLAVLSKRSNLLYSYFKQLFAQVTNPAIDPIREQLVMSLDMYIGPESNILATGPQLCKRVRVQRPIFTNEDTARIRHNTAFDFTTKVISIIADAAVEDDFISDIERICSQAVEAITQGYSCIMLSDRGFGAHRCAIPALLAVGAVHQYLVARSLRAQTSIIIESAEPREVHHCAVLFGYGADCINPYGAFEAIAFACAEGECAGELPDLIAQYIHALEQGILKILSKMGISTLQSYRGAQIFEALGIGPEVIERCFTGTSSRIGGIDFKTIAQETRARHQDAYGIGKNVPYLQTGGVYQWRKDGEYHLWNPETIAALQDATQTDDYGRYLEFAARINIQNDNPTTLRSLFAFKKTTAISLERVEPVESIVKRFVTGAMSFGSISKGAHEALAHAMNALGGKSNTGEGGENPQRFIPLPGGISLRSAVKQVASGRFGVTTNYLVNADELQIKIAQGAKPGEGGQLPGHKVSAIIAKTRYTTEGVTLISPPPHHDIYSIEDLAQLIFDLKNVNPRARISVKLVSEIGVGTIAAGVAKGHADMILISGGDGGTGASPLSSIMYAGLPWELGLSETHQTLMLNNLRSRVRLQTDGQMRTGRDIVIAALLGAEEYGFSTAALIVMGCVMLRHCHLNNCALGVATQDPVLEKRFRGKAENVVRYMRFVAREVREIMASLGVATCNELIGRTELLEQRGIAGAYALDLSKILYQPPVSSQTERYCVQAQEHAIAKVLDHRLIILAEPALRKHTKVQDSLLITNVERATGAMLSGEVCRVYGEEGLAPDTIHFKFTGVAGQSFGAFLAKGVTFELEGLANDYVGKGISGGKIIIYPYQNVSYDAGENILIGNTSFYGAICGEAYINGKAGERFCIRNSGLTAVIEGVGDHCCEYMTGGCVAVLGATGRNFAAGMSGGVAYVFDPDQAFSSLCNMEMVQLEALEDEDAQVLRAMLQNHIKYTKSARARMILDTFETQSKKFVKVMPLEYKRILAHQRSIQKPPLADILEG